MNIQKYSGAGNKFFIIDNLDESILQYANLVKELCRKDIATDGVIFLEKSDIADFKMNYYNRDGSGNSLCGNGLRCTMKFINDNKISGNDELKIEAVNETYFCRFIDKNKISVSFPPPLKIKLNFKLKVKLQSHEQLLNCSYVNCGSPHIVIFINEIENPKIDSLDNVDIFEWGRSIRFHKDLQPEGANVNFVKVISEDDSNLEIRSYERGVEGETLACGTGAISTAVVFNMLKNQNQPVKILTRSGEFLFVGLELNQKKISGIKLTGTAEKIQ